jgi:hypothetical protein
LDTELAKDQFEPSDKDRASKFAPDHGNAPNHRPLQFNKAAPAKPSDISTTELSEHEYNELKEFPCFYSSRYMSIDRVTPELRPAACLEILEQKSHKMASRGLRQAINDIIEMSRHTNHGQVGKIDSELKRQNIVTLSELRRRFSKDYARIIKRGKINNETEYYLARLRLRPTSRV